MLARKIAKAIKLWGKLLLEHGATAEDAIAACTVLKQEINSSPKLSRKLQRLSTRKILGRLTELYDKIAEESQAQNYNVQRAQETLLGQIITVNLIRITNLGDPCDYW